MEANIRPAGLVIASETSRTPLGNCARHAGSWLRDQAFPLWIERGVDWEGGGYFDSLDPTTRENAASIKRLRTLTRQIYAFAEAARLDVPRAREAVDHGLVFLLGRARAPDGGFFSSFDLEGRPTSTALDTYDLAFVLFALRHAFGLTGAERLVDEALGLLAFMETVLRNRHGGFAEGRPDGLPRRQNPHMHLFEACLAWMEVDSGGPFRRVADELVHLFATRFVDPGTGAVLEYFGPDLTLDLAAQREAVEPGHLYEWIWLLSRYEKLTGERQRIAADRLHSFAHRHGSNRESGLLFGELDRVGTVRDASVRLWPHAEWLRAEIVRLGCDREGDPAPALAAFVALRRFLDAAPAGLWVERFDAPSRSFVRGPAPATSLYHIVGALTVLSNAGDPAHDASAVCT